MSEVTQVWKADTTDVVRKIQEVTEAVEKLNAALKELGDVKIKIDVEVSENTDQKGK